MTLVERLCRLRGRHGWTLREQSAAIEQATGHVMSLSYLRSLELMPDRSPSIETLVRIAAGYGMCVQELLAPVLFDPGRRKG